jgi:hypothetical protein
MENRGSCGVYCRRESGLEVDRADVVYPYLHEDRLMFSRETIR